MEPHSQRLLEIINCNLFIILIVVLTSVSELTYLYLCKCIYNYYKYNTVCVFTTLQVSELCPGDIPTTVGILITNSTDDTTIQNINDVMLMEGSQDNILTTVDSITLQSDMKYSIQISYNLISYNYY